MNQFDIIIIGGGAAGWSAALSAVQENQSVLLFEKLPQSGGSSAKSGGCLAFAGTQLQRDNNVEDSPDLLYRDLIEIGKQENDPVLVRKYCDTQLSAYQWLVDIGVRFSPLIETASGQSVPRVHSIDPADMVRLMQNLAIKSKKCVYKQECPIKSLISENGVVKGVTDSDGNNYYANKGVIIASGGFAKNPEMLRRFAPQYAEAIVVAGDGSTGDGLKMGWKLGADLRDMAYIKGTFGKHPTDEHSEHSLQAVYKGAVAVNQNGKRFVNESISYKLLGDAVMAQPWSVAYQIMDQAIFDTGDDRVRILDFGRRLEEGLFIVGNTLDEIAEQAEIDPQTLNDTIKRYNEYVENGEDIDFGRANMVHRHGSLVKIEKPPFYAYPSTAVVFGTYCGLRIDDTARVINVDDEVIGGLYAAGEVTGGFHGAAYMTGSALGKAVVFGRIAALEAAKA